MSNENNYEVGYRKPPKKTRFQKGISGNPGGRPKSSRSFESIYDELYSKKLGELKLTADTNVKEAIALKGVKLMLEGKHQFAQATGALNKALHDDDGPKEIEVRLILEEDEEERWRGNDVDPLGPALM